MRVGVVSGQFTTLLRGRIAPVLRQATALGWSRLQPVLAHLSRRLRRFDLAGSLIGLADGIEASFGRARRLLGRRGIGLTGGLLWRGLAAMTGIGLATTLVASLSAESEEIRLATLTVEPASETRPVRDVRREPTPVVGALRGEHAAWMRIQKPLPMFGIEAPEFERHPAAYEARRTQDGTAREDMLVFGDFAEPKAHLQIRLLVEQQPAQAQPFVIALVRDAAARGMSVQRSGMAAAVETRFGMVEAADVTLSDGDGSRACLAFRKEAGEMPLAFGGWFCGAADRPADRRQLACLVDRLDLVNAGDDKALRAAFARSELNRASGCATPRLSAGGRKTSWLDADAPPPALRMKSAAATERDRQQAKRKIVQ